uniref:Uncharacterized protein n=1 Tax=Ditylenchus dipsaci TaxID=166011 RepID=A0A915ECD1_9BILA
MSTRGAGVGQANQTVHSSSVGPARWILIQQALALKGLHYYNISTGLELLLLLCLPCIYYLGPQRLIPMMRYTAKHFSGSLGTTYCYLLLVLWTSSVYAKRKHTHGSTLQVGRL